MNVVCNSPKFEVTNDQASYFHIPGSFMATSNTEKTSPGYFDINPRSSPVQTPYFDAPKPQSPVQTPFYDCETLQTPFFEPLQLHHGHNIQPKFQLQINNHNVNVTPNGVGNLSSATNSSSPGLTFRQPPFQGVTPSWVQNGTFDSRLPLQRRQSLNPKSSVTKKPHSMPAGLSPFTSPFEEYSVDSVAVMIKQQQSSSESTSPQKFILLLDLRSFSMFASSRIKTSLNICVPNTLLKRGSFSIDKITENLVSDVDKDIFKDWPKYENVVLYDGNSSCLSDNGPIFHLCKKFKSPNCKVKVGYLKGGYSAFSLKYEELCEKTVINGMSSSSSTFPRRLLSISRKPGPFTCPTPMIEMSGVNPFFSNIRQNMEMSSGITETIPVRIPQGITLDRSKLPKFMLDVVYGDNGDRKLAEAFHEIERDEQRRLQSLMLHNSNQVTSESPFSIAAGMEKGTKNRYHNIWPYDHARVKIGECKEGDCDYVNASYVQVDGCNKRYIATQGPLPATYDDFWKVIWEQNSRIIVMLTKEQEAGRIQCHRYWAECTVNPCRFGPLELLLISEYSTSHETDGVTENNITVRKFRLCHRNLPELPAREITQLHFLGWPDFGIPDSPHHILNLIEIANSAQLQASQQCDISQEIGPMVVHCSAGCGRTGAFCTIDSVLSMFHENKFDNRKDIVQETVARFREQRLSMVKTLRQYVFCYEAILWKLSGAV